MNENRQKLLHIRSSVLNKVPSGSQIDFGEIAVNYAEGHEFLSIKNTSSDQAKNVVTFSSDKYYEENIIGSGFTSGNTVRDELDEINQRLNSGTSSGDIISVVEEYVGSGITSAFTVTDALGDKITSAFTVTNALGDKIQPSSSVTNYFDDIYAQLAGISASGGPHTHLNKTTLDNITETTEETHEFISNLFGSGITSANTVTDAINGLESTLGNDYYTKSEIEEMENIVASSLNDLYINKIDSAFTYSKAVIDSKTSGDTFDASKYYTTAQTDSAISAYSYSKNDIVTELGYETFSTSSTYSVGDVVRYNGTTLYKFVVDHPAGAWNSSQVVQTSVNELIQDAASSGGTFDPTQYYTKTEINSNEKVIAKALNDLNNYRMFNVGSNTVNSLNGIPTTKRLVIASGITSSNNTLILDGVLQEGYEMYIIVNGTSDTAIVLDSNMINTSGEPITINSNGYCEISIISVSNGETYYVRGV